MCCIATPHQSNRRPYLAEVFSGGRRKYLGAGKVLFLLSYIQSDGSHFLKSPFFQTFYSTRRRALFSHLIFEPFQILSLAPKPSTCSATFSSSSRSLPSSLPSYLLQLPLTWKSAPCLLSLNSFKLAAVTSKKKLQTQLVWLPPTLPRPERNTRGTRVQQTSPPAIQLPRATNPRRTVLLMLSTATRNATLLGRRSLKKQKRQKKQNRLQPRLARAQRVRRPPLLQWELGSRLGLHSWLA